MSTTAPPSSMPRLPAWLRGVILALLAVFAMYLQPDFMLTLADQVWACF